MTNTTISDIVRYADKTARERNVKWMDATILLKALLWSASEAYRILQYGGLGYSEDNPDYLARFDRELVRFDNEPLEEGEKPRFTPVALRLVEHANSPLALLRAMQHTDCEGNLILKEHWIWPPEHEPTDEQVERAAEAGYFLSARSYFSYGNLKPWGKVKQTSKEKWRNGRGSCSKPHSTEKSPTDMRKVETKIPDESALYLRRLRTEQERKEFEERYGLRLETNTPLSPFLEHLMLDMHPIFPNVAHRTVLTNTGAWNPQTIRKNTKRITDENMLQKVMGKNA